jgi:DNA-binding CsgD family transcriptional regulator
MVDDLPPHPFLTLDALEQLLALLGEAVAVVRDDGRVVYRNAAAADLLDGRTGRGLLAEVRAAGLRALGAAPTPGDERVSRLRAARLATVAGSPPLAAVVLARPTVNLPPAAELVWQFGLTAREASVARLLAEGRGNASVARALGIRDTTARHYTESVLLKLGVPSRSAVAAAILGAYERTDEHPVEASAAY